MIQQKCKCCGKACYQEVCWECQQLIKKPDNTDEYNDAWHELLAARQQGDFGQVHIWAEEVAHHARVLEREQHSHHGVICSHTFDSRGVCTRCGYNASQTANNH